MRFTEEQMKQIACEQCKRDLRNELSEPIYYCKVDSNFRIVLPKSWREQNNIKPGDKISLGVSR